MATYDARPSAFTQLSSTSDWEYLLGVITDVGVDGIDPGIGSAMVPSLDTGGRNAVLADGVVSVRGQLWRCDASVSTPIPAASAQNRIDRLVLRYTRGASTSPTVVQPVVITGTPSGSPVIPSITRTSGGIWDLPISRWTATSAGALTSLADERQFSRTQLSVYKTANTSRASTTTRTNDPDLVVGPLVENAVYQITGYFSYGSLSAAGVGFAFGFNVPAGATGRFVATMPTTATVANDNDFAWTEYAGSGGKWGAAFTPGDGNNHGLIVSGTLFMGPTIGFCGLSWAQDSSNATALTLNAGSYLIANRIDNNYNS